MIFKLFPEGQCLVYWSHTNTILSRGSGACPHKNFLEPNCLQRRKMPLDKIGEMERIQYEGQFLLLLPPPALASLKKHVYKKHESEIWQVEV